MTDWIKHTTDTCPVDPETVVEVRISPRGLCYKARAGDLCWDIRHWSHYRIITPAKPRKPEGKEIDPRGTRMWTERQPDFITPAKPPEPEMTKTAQEHAAAMFATAIKPEPDLIALRLECLKLASKAIHVSDPDDWTEFADTLLHYVLNGSVDKA